MKTPQKKTAKIARIAILGAFLLLAVPAAKQVRASSINTTLAMPRNNLGLVGYWSFDGTEVSGDTSAYDSSGNGTTLTVQVGARPFSLVPGAIGQAIKIEDGAGRGNLHSATPSSALLFNGPITMSAWVDYHYKSYGPEVFAEEDGASVPQSMSIKTDCGGQHAYAYFGVGNRVGGGGCWTGPSFPLNTWTLVTVTADGSYWKMYYNGSLVYSLATTTEAVAGTSFTIGGDYHYSASFQDNSIDDARVYNRALSAAEVEELYQEGVGSHIDSSLAGEATTTINVTLTPPNLAQGLVGHWAFDGKDMINNVTDTSGNGNNGDLVGFTSTSSAVTPGVLGQALSFNGTSQYVSAPGSASLDGAKTTWTTSVWIYLPSAPVGNPEYTYAIYYGRSAAPGFAYYKMLLEYFNKTLAVRSAPSTGFVLSPNIANPLHTWHLITVTLDTNDLLTIYADGVAIKTGFATPYTIGTGGPLTLGNLDGSSGSFPLYEDDVRVYNRALSAAEVKQLYQLGR